MFVTAITKLGLYNAPNRASLRIFTAICFQCVYDFMSIISIDLPFGLPFEIYGVFSLNIVSSIPAICTTIYRRLYVLYAFLRDRASKSTLEI